MGKSSIAKLINSELHGSGSSSGVHGFPAENELEDLRFRLAYNLQSTLELHHAIDLFFTNMKEITACSGLTYVNENLNIKLELGTIEKHNASYNVASGKTKLGVLTLSRDKRFFESELAMIEMLNVVLFYPLRNALLYRAALENSMRDTLTGIGNRAAMDMNFDRELKLAKRQHTPLALLVIDIDHFKSVNDTYGHHNGDKILCHVVKTIQATLRETDQIFRFGGEEFVVLLNGADLSSAHMIAERIRLNQAMSIFSLPDDEITCTVSIGVSSLRNDDSSVSLFERADAALYSAKNAGRNTVVCSPDDRENEIPQKVTA